MGAAAGLAAVKLGIAAGIAGAGVDLATNAANIKFGLANCVLNTGTELAAYTAALKLGIVRGWREPGNKALQRSRIFGLVLFIRGVTDQEGRSA